ncbi:MAG: hypothetical protein IPP52_06340 [Ignavibacteria bacterium]|nr:hypothetical protein [Ignavibacteria bacterium]
METSLENSDLPRTLNVWLKMINEAKESVDIETFYFANEKGKPLEQIIAALKDAAGRGNSPDYSGFRFLFEKRQIS